MSSRPRTVTRALALWGAALLVSVSACSGEDSTPEAGDSPGPTASATPTPTPEPTPPPKPKVGSCHVLSWNDALAPTATVAGESCTKSTSLTFHVGTLKADQVDSTSAQEQIAKACPKKLRSYLGGTSEQRRLSVLTTVWFTPTIEEEEQGADWYRCDLVAPSNGKLLKVKRGMRDSIGTERAAKYELCAKGSIGSKTFTHVACAKKHSWKAISTVNLSGEKYPGRKAIAATLTQPCTDAATAVASNKRDVTWGQEGPTKAQWKAGQRYGYCWAPA
ncbi:septum formation family protein [Nocardioides yefusunii]|uniref:Septum formation family protein n=1 Tax=Nocardioides yefusunii TaxID=2500546 RepID=A0ABW1QVX8_9ACTN|nr:septum formation family protein [Nocardioides yefusunii]